MPYERKVFSEWHDGEVNRPLRFYLPCECDCDGKNGLGYLSGSDEVGHGFTLWFQDKKQVEALWEVLEMGVREYALFPTAKAVELLLEDCLMATVTTDSGKAVVSGV